jgi:hypothetical protein
MGDGRTRVLLPTPASPVPMTIVRMTDLDLSGKRVLIRQGEPV